MSITSLTAIASAGISDLSSAYLFLNNNGASKRIDLDDLQDLGMAQIGVMVVTSDTQGLAAGTGIFSGWQAAEYDFGGWWNSASGGMIVVPNDHYDYVVAGFNIFLNRGDVSDIGLYVNSVFTYGGPFCRNVSIGAGDGSLHNAMSAPIAVNSGDTFQIYYNTDNANSVVAGTDTFFWVMPWKGR